jgi:hypothetical protein
VKEDEDMYKSILNNYLMSLEALESYALKFRAVIMKSSIESFTDKENELAFFLYQLLDSEEFVIERFNLDEKTKREVIAVVEMLEDSETKAVFEKEFQQISDYSEVNKAAKELQLLTQQFILLYESSIISLITYFELLISRVIKHHLVKFPYLLNSVY